jgi:hypothetical protein
MNILTLLQIIITLPLKEIYALYKADENKKAL